MCVLCVVLSHQTCTPRFCFDKRDVGCRVNIHNSRYDEWVPGDITAYDGMKKMHMVCMSVCVCVWMCVCMGVSMGVYMYVSVCMCLCVFMHVCVYMCVCADCVR